MCEESCSFISSSCADLPHLSLLRWWELALDSSPHPLQWDCLVRSSLALYPASYAVSSVYFSSSGPVSLPLLTKKAPERVRAYLSRVRSCRALRSPWSLEGVPVLPGGKADAEDGGVCRSGVATGPQHLCQRAVPAHQPSAPPLSADCLGSLLLPTLPSSPEWPCYGSLFHGLKVCLSHLWPPSFLPWSFKASFLISFWVLFTQNMW